MQTINFFVFVFKSAKFVAFLELLGPLGLSLGLGSGSKAFLGPTYVENQLQLWNYSPIFLFLFWPQFGPLGLFFLALWAFFWGLGEVQNIFGTYICSKSTLVFEVQPYLFVFDSARFGAFFPRFWPVGTIFGVQVRFKNVFGTHLHRLTTFIQ